MTCRATARWDRHGRDAWEPQRERLINAVMTMTDPIADFLTRLRNANSAYHDEVTLPHSKIKANIAEILKKEGCLLYTSDAADDVYQV